MSKATMIGSLTCQEGKEEETEAVLAKMVAASANEPGVEIYSYHKGEDCKFWFFAIMTSADSMQVHGQTDAMKEAMEEFMPLLAGQPEMSMATPVAAYGMDI